MMQLPESVTSFTDYFKLTPDPEKAANFLGYDFVSAEVVLPRIATNPAWATVLRDTLQHRLTKTRLVSETARREILIAPVLSAVVDRYDVQWRIEYEVQASPRLSGSLDYFLRSREHFLVVEAKNEDMNRGASQLVAEMVAVEIAFPSESPLLYGALSIGTVWQFMVLYRDAKRFEQDVALYRVPNEVPDLCAILIGILRVEPEDGVETSLEISPL